MARLGTVFVELNIDDKVFKQKLSEELTSTQTTAKGIEQVWKHLGVQNDATFDAQRRSYENALKLIKASSTSTANDIVRAEKAKNEQIARLNELQFGKQTSFLQSLKGHWLAVTAAITASIFAIQRAWNMADQAAQFEQSKAAFRSMVQSMGGDADQLFSKLRGLSAGLIDQKSLTEAANRAMSLGIPIEKLGDLLVIARAKARDMGITTSQAFNDIATGVGRASPLILDNLGLVMKVGSANDALAASLGKTAAELTDKEKKQAVLNATLEAGREALARYDLSVKTSKERMDTLVASVKDAQLFIGTLTLRLFGITGIFQGAASAATLLAAGLMKVAEGYARILSFVPGIGKHFSKLAEDLKNNANIAFESSKDLAEKGEANLKLIFAKSEEINSAIKRTVTQTAEDIKTVADTTKKELEDLYISEAEYQSWYWETTTEMVNDAMEERAKAMDKAKESTKELTKETEKGFDELQRAIEGWGKESADAIVDFCLTGKTSFSDMIQSMIADLMKMLVYQQLVKPLFDFLGAAISGGGWINNSYKPSLTGPTMYTGNAQGNAFDRGNVIPFARGGVVTKPTIFPMASGAGLMGEAGPEAVLPLKRTSGGNLGVAASAGQPIINIEIINQSKSNVEVKETSSDNGMSKVVFLIKDIVSKDISGGGVIHNSLRSTFGASPKVLGR